MTADPHTVASRVVGTEADQQTRDYILGYLMESERGAEILGEIWNSNTDVTFYWSDRGTYANNEHMWLDRNENLEDLLPAAAHEIYHVRAYVGGERSWPGQDGYVPNMLGEEARAHAAAFVIHMQTGRRYPAPRNFGDFRHSYRNIVTPSRGQPNFANVTRAGEFFCRMQMSNGLWLTSNTNERYRDYYERFHQAALQNNQSNQSNQPAPSSVAAAARLRQSPRTPSTPTVAKINEADSPTRPARGRPGGQSSSGIRR
ncbi:hypothetical protein [Micromonospora sp. NPDC047527]|uniref:hypothetical protein n=1 Tax=Micromonospora sp. NPDC047527 TaxID=3155144 RepID=UPI0033E043B1